MKNERHDLGIRPKCQHSGCDKDCQFVGSYRKDGSPIFRKLCSTHHFDKIAKKRGMKNISEVMAKNAGFDKVGELLDHRAQQKGFDKHSEYLNSIHPYRQYRKKYCENKDGRLGYKCKCKIMIPAQLQVDHINGDPYDNRPENLQTLCANCHIFKTHQNGDGKTAGRKKLKSVVSIQHHADSA